MSLALRGKIHSKETREKKSQRAIEARRKLHEALLSPERKEAHEFYLSLPSNMDLREKRRLLHQKIKNKPKGTINRWIRKWQSGA